MRSEDRHSPKSVSDHFKQTNAARFEFVPWDDRNRAQEAVEELPRHSMPPAQQREQREQREHETPSERERPRNTVPVRHRQLQAPPPVHSPQAHSSSAASVTSTGWTTVEPRSSSVSRSRSQTPSPSSRRTSFNQSDNTHREMRGCSRDIGIVYSFYMNQHSLLERDDSSLGREPQDPAVNVEVSAAEQSLPLDPAECEEEEQEKQEESPVGQLQQQQVEPAVQVQRDELASSKSRPKRGSSSGGGGKSRASPGMWQTMPLHRLRHMSGALRSAIGDLWGGSNRRLGEQYPSPTSSRSAESPAAAQHRSQTTTQTVADDDVNVFRLSNSAIRSPTHTATTATTATTASTNVGKDRDSRFCWDAIAKEAAAVVKESASIHAPTIVVSDDEASNEEQEIECEEIEYDEAEDEAKQPDLSLPRRLGMNASTQARSSVSAGREFGNFVMQQAIDTSPHDLRGSLSPLPSNNATWDSVDFGIDSCEIPINAWNQSGPLVVQQQQQQLSDSRRLKHYTAAFLISNKRTRSRAVEVPVSLLDSSSRGGDRRSDSDSSDAGNDGSMQTLGPSDAGVPMEVGGPNPTSTAAATTTSAMPSNIRRPSAASAAATSAASVAANAASAAAAAARSVARAVAQRQKREHSAWNGSGKSKAHDSRLENEEKRKSRVVNQKSAILELVNTEKTYLHRLRQMMKDFRLRLQAHVELNGITPIIEQEEINCLFANLPTLVSLHTKLYLEIKGLRARKQLQKELANILLQFADEIQEPYSQYAMTFAVYPKLVQQLQKANPGFHDFVRVSERCSSNRLDSLLPRYLLLVEAIRKYTSKDSPEYVSIDACVTKFREVADNVDVSMKVAQARQRVVDIQQIFFQDAVQPSLITEDRYCVREGELDVVRSVQSRKGWVSKRTKRTKPYMFFLFNDCLLYASGVVATTNAANSSRSRGRLKAVIPLNRLSVSLVDDSFSELECACMFVLYIEGKEPLYVSAKSETSRNDWKYDIEVCIKEYKERARSLESWETENSRIVDDLAKTLSRRNSPVSGQWPAAELVNTSTHWDDSQD